eukprot:scaffold26543_cov30-Tisochrysis_lutea.AAC.2
MHRLTAHRAPKTKMLDPVDWGPTICIPYYFAAEIYPRATKSRLGACMRRLKGARDSSPLVRRCLLQSCASRGYAG